MMNKKVVLILAVVLAAVGAVVVSQSVASRDTDTAVLTAGQNDATPACCSKKAECEKDKKCCGKECPSETCPCGKTCPGNTSAAGCEKDKACCDKACSSETPTCGKSCPDKKPAPEKPADDNDD